MVKSIPISELSRQTGITVRTLRYYEQIGLLIPSSKTPGKHRMYGDRELMKLEQIQFLKKLGFSLQEISDIFTNRQWDWASSLNNQLDYVLNEQQKLKQMESALRGLIHSIAVEGDTSWTVVQRLIQLSGSDPSLKEAFRHQMFEEREVKLLGLLPNMNSNDPDSLEWIALLGQLKNHMKDGPDSSEVQRIIRRMDEKSAAQFQDEDIFIEKLWNIRKSPDQSKQMGLYPIEDELIDLLEKAFDIYISKQTDPQPEQEGEK